MNNEVNIFARKLLLTNQPFYWRKEEMFGIIAALPLSQGIQYRNWFFFHLVTQTSKVILLTMERILVENMANCCGNLFRLNMWMFLLKYSMKKNHNSSSIQKKMFLSGQNTNSVQLFSRQTIPCYCVCSFIFLRRIHNTKFTDAQKHIIAGAFPKA